MKVRAIEITAAVLILAAVIWLIALCGIQSDVHF